MKRIKIDSYDVARQKQYKKQQEELKQLLHNGASEDKSSSNTYKDRSEYHRTKERERLLELIAGAESQGNIIKSKEYRSELDKFNIVCNKKERSKLIKELKVILKKLYYSFIHQKEQDR